MSELRLIILAIGLVFLAAVYFFSRRSEKAKRERALRQRPHVDDFPEIHVDEAMESYEEAPPHSSTAPAETTAPTTSSNQTASGWERGETDRLIISLYVVSSSKREFPGAATQAALEQAGLRFGRHNIFHYMPESGATQSLFSAANISEPGSFERDRLVDSNVAGLTFFMLLPGPREALEAFTKLLGAARQVTSALGGKLEDELHGSLTPQRIQQMREQIIEFQARERTAKTAAIARRQSG